MLVARVTSRMLPQTSRVGQFSLFNHKNQVAVTHNQAVPRISDQSLDEAIGLIRHQAVMNNTILSYVPPEVTPMIQLLMASVDPAVERVKPLLDHAFEKDTLELNTSLLLLTAKAIGSEITSQYELLCQVVHNYTLGVVFHDTIIDTKKYTKDTLTCNQVTTLVGDLFMANVVRKLAEMRNIPVLEQITLALVSHTEGKFISDVTDSRTWIEKTFKSDCSMDAHSLKSVVILSRGNQRLQNAAFQFGKNFALVRRIRKELESFTENTASISSLPVLYAFKGHESELKHMSRHDMYHQAIDRQGMEITLNQMKEYQREAMGHLLHFEPSKERIALQKIVLGHV